MFIKYKLSSTLLMTDTIPKSSVAIADRAVVSVVRTKNWTE